MQVRLRQHGHQVVKEHVTESFVADDTPIV